jgi:hypothetical protein
MSEHAISTVNCRAFGCNMLGTMSRATTGTSDWFCFAHFGAEPEDWQAVTAELNRLRWLVDIARRVRETMHSPKEWPSVVEALNKELVLSQRSDLQKGDHESALKWLTRLESVLSMSCLEAVRSKP